MLKFLTGALLAFALTAGSAAASERAANHAFAPSLAPAFVADIQEQLADMGYYAGPIDGIAGPQTRRSILAYQRDIGVPADGIADPQLSNRLHFGMRPRTVRAPAERPTKPTAKAAAADEPAPASGASEPRAARPSVAHAFTPPVPTRKPTPPAAAPTQEAAAAPAQASAAPDVATPPATDAVPAGADVYVIHVERALDDMGYEVGVVDGVVDARLERAIIDFRVDAGVKGPAAVTPSLIGQIAAYRGRQAGQPAPADATPAPDGTSSKSGDTTTSDGGSDAYAPEAAPASDTDVPSGRQDALVVMDIPE